MSSLFPYQKVGVDFLRRNRRAYLADEMGLGKTVQALVAARGLRQALLIAPASVIPNWQQEAAEWNPGLHLVTVSYTKLAMNPTEYQRPWEAVIMDEAHYAKSPRAKRTKAAMSVAQQAERAWLLSGTPIPNDPTELWSAVSVLWPEIPERLGIDTAFEWMCHFTLWKRTQFGAKPYAVKNKEQLRDALAPIMLRRMLRTVAMELPALRVTTSWLPPIPGMEAELEEQGLVPGEDPNDNPNASRVRRILGQHKVPQVAAILKEELKEGQYKKIVVLAYHLESLRTLRRELGEFGVVGYDGSATGPQRQEAINQFTRDPKVRVFVGQQTAAGTGVNLQVASEIVLVEPAWSPAENLQAIKRIHRIGQDSPCRARIFGVRKSLDEALTRTVANKLRMINDVGL